MANATSGMRVVEGVAYEWAHAIADSIDAYALDA